MDHFPRAWSRIASEGDRLKMVILVARHGYRGLSVNTWYMFSEDQMRRPKMRFSAKRRVSPLILPCMKNVGAQLTNTLSLLHFGQKNHKSRSDNRSLSKRWRDMLILIPSHFQGHDWTTGSCPESYLHLRREALDRSLVLCHKDITGRTPRVLKSPRVGFVAFYKLLLLTEADPIHPISDSSKVRVRRRNWRLFCCVRCRTTDWIVKWSKCIALPIIKL